MKKRHQVRRYTDEDGKRQVFRVFITHGRSRLWQKVKRFLENDLNVETTVLVDRFRGSVIFDKLEDAAWECDCAVVIATPDDRLSPSVPPRARQNVIHEIGYLQALFGDRELVIILKEETVEWFTNIQGIEYIGFHGNKIAEAFPKLRDAIDDTFDYFNQE